MWNSRLNESLTGIKIARRNIKNFRYADDATLMAESEEDLKSILMKEKEESEKADLKLNIQKTKIMASSPIISCKHMGKQWKQWEALFSWSPKSLQMVTAAMKLKALVPWKKSYDQSQFSSVQFSRSVVSDSLQPHESQHARSPCPSTPGVHSDSHPSSQWCHPAVCG